MKPRIVIIGETSEDRKSLVNKLSRFYGIPEITLEDLVKTNKKQEFEKISNELRFKLSLLENGKGKDGFILNGIPLDVKDCKCLGDVDLCVFFNIDEEKVIKLSEGRRWCPTCFKLYHLEARPPMKEGRCDRCDSKITILEDDNPRTIRNRVAEWFKMHEAMLDFYKRKYKLLKIKEDHDLEKIASTVFKILNGDLKSESTDVHEFEM